jgi:hypothetical protein
MLTARVINLPLRMKSALYQPSYKEGLQRILGTSKSKPPEAKVDFFNSVTKSVIVLVSKDIDPNE